MVGLLGAYNFGALASSPWVLFPLFIVVFYLLVIRPQQKKQKEQQSWLEQLKKGDEVITTSGFWGKIVGTDTSSPYVTLELQEKVRVRVLRSYLAGKAPEPKSQSAATEEKK